MGWLATIALLLLLVDCSGAPEYRVQGPVPPGNRPELVCNTTDACLTALPVPTGTTRRGP